MKRYRFLQSILAALSTHFVATLVDHRYCFDGFLNHEEHEEHEGTISCNVCLRALRVLRGEIKFILYRHYKVEDLLRGCPRIESIHFIFTVAIPK